MENKIKTTLKLLNVVEAKTSDKTRPVVTDSGLVIIPEAFWAKDIIVDYYKKQQLTPEQLNKTFHKSWKKIETSSRLELLFEQLTHYASTYGTDFTGEVYLPNEQLDVPEEQIKVRVVLALSASEINQRLLAMLQSGVALDSDTIGDIVYLLEEYGHKFSVNDGIKNKEAIALIADKYGIYPEDPTEFLRYCVFKSTGKTLLIKNKKTYDEIKASDFNPSDHFKTYGLEKLSKIFNRFKPIFLSYKKKCPSVINKISKLSKDNHVPFVQSDLNTATSKRINKIPEGATTFALLRSWGAIQNARFCGSGRVFTIRNGKSFVKDGGVDYDISTLSYNESIIVDELRKRINLDKSVYIPDNIDYALPVSTKLFVGNIPTGTRFYGKNLGVGIYWETKGGSDDIDLSGITENGKVGWNASYNQNGQLLYSGDITSASKGAVEYLYSSSDKIVDTIVMSNIYRGRDDAEYSLIVGECPKKDNNYMMNPNKTIAHIKSKSVEKQTVLGVVYNIDNKQCYSMVNVGAGASRVSGYGEHSELARDVFINKWKNCLTLRDALQKLGVKLVDKTECDVDLSLDVVTKETFIDLFSKNS